MKQMFVIAFLVVLIARCNTNTIVPSSDAIDSTAIEKFQKEIDSVDAIVKPPPRDTVVVTKTYNWEYHDSKDHATGKNIHQARIRANDDINLDSPKSAKAIIYIVLTNIGDTTGALLMLSKGTFNHTDGEIIRAQFDSAETNYWKCKRTDDSKALYINQVSKFISSLKTAQTLRIESELYKNHPETMEFNIAGLEWK